MENELKQLNNEIVKIRIDLDIIKGLLTSKIDEEGELSDWAKEELERARNTPLTECISHEEVKKRMSEKWNGK